MCVHARLGAFGLPSGGKGGVRVDPWEVGGLGFDSGWRVLIS
jgi:hypothetical protein